jgi:hypothetical protein
MVRPEAIAISQEDGQLAGEVLHASFLGNCTRVAVSCRGCAEPVLAELHGRDANSVDRLRPGARVWLSWDAASEIAIEDAETREEEADG